MQDSDLRLQREGMRMTQFSEATEASRVSTMEEITSLTEEGGKPADTLMNVVALIATRFRTDVCSAYLLEPDRSNLVSCGDSRPAPALLSGRCACRSAKDSPAWLLSRSCRSPLAMSAIIPASNISRNPAKRSITPSSACRWSIAEFCKAFSIVQTKEARVFRES